MARPETVKDLTVNSYFQLFTLVAKDNLWEHIVLHSLSIVGMSEQHAGFRISWPAAGDAVSKADFETFLRVIESICTPFAIRQLHLLGLLPPLDSHPRVLDNACGNGGATECLHDAYAEAGKAIDITCCDLSPGMVSSVEHRIKEANWTNVKAFTVNAEVVGCTTLLTVGARLSP